MSDHFPAHAWATKWPNLHNISRVWQDWVGKTHVVQRSPLEIHMFLKLPQSLRALKPGCSSVLLWICCGLTFRKSCSDRGVGGDETEDEPLQYQQRCWGSISVWWHWPRSPTPLTLTFIRFPCSGSWCQDVFLSCHQNSPDSLALHGSVMLETAWQPKMQKPWDQTNKDSLPSYHLSSSCRLGKPAPFLLTS